MRKEIINKYKINFENRIDKFNKIDKFPIMEEGYLSLFLYGWNSRHITENLLPDIEQALLDSNSEFENGNEVISILIYQNNVIFYHFDDPPFSIPTVDFKEIVIGWRDFLLQRPLDGTKRSFLFLLKFFISSLVCESRILA